MKSLKTFLLILLAVGLPVIGIAAIIAYALCKAEDRKPPKDYVE